MSSLRNKSDVIDFEFDWRFFAARAVPDCSNARRKTDFLSSCLLYTSLLGYNLPRDVWENLPLDLTDTFDTSPWDLILPDAIQQALSRRTELLSLRKQIDLEELNIVNAKSGYKPSVQVFAGYNWMNNSFSGDVGNELDGWNAGAQMTWSIFDGALTRGKVIQAKAQYKHAQTDLADQSRQIELAVRTAYSDFLEARETLESQQKVQEEADEALREANARAEAGNGTQLDVLDAQTLSLIHI